MTPAAASPNADRLTAIRPVASRALDEGAALLSVQDLVMQFGGLRAVDGFSFDVPAGQVTSLIGPNGAGKTTVINMIMGAYQPTSGTVSLAGARVDGRSGEWRARNGLGRTFQNIRLFPSMTAQENVLVGAEAWQSSGVVAALLGTPRFRSERCVSADLAASCLDAVGLGATRNSLASALSYGQQRRLEIARALALRPSALLLDEPAAGSNPAEKEELGHLIRDLADRGLAVLLIEHDMGLVMRISEHVVVMNFGVKIAEGSPEAVRRVPDVIAAYLGGVHGAA